MEGGETHRGLSMFEVYIGHFDRVSACVCVGREGGRFGMVVAALEGSGKAGWLRGVETEQLNLLNHVGSGQNLHPRAMKNRQGHNTAERLPSRTQNPGLRSGQAALCNIETARFVGQAGRRQTT